MTQIIELKNVYKAFKTKYIITQALTNISLSVQEGDFVGITGPSGCGKSTLLSILGILESPDKGNYRLANVDVSTLDPRQKAHIRNKHIGFIFQSFNLIEELNVIENVSLPLQIIGMEKKERRYNVERVLYQVGLNKRMNHYPSQLSGGQQQRVAIARALVNSPDIILADEPTGNLDNESGKMIMSILVDLHNAGQTILMVSHDKELVRLAKTQIKILDGCIL